MDTKIDLRLKSELKEQLQEMANSQGIRVSDFVRQILSDFIAAKHLSDKLCPTNETPSAHKTQNKPLDVSNKSLAQILAHKRKA